MPPAAPAAAARDGWRKWLPALFPPAVALLAFANTVPGDFVFDDAVVIQGDARLRAFDLRRIARENYWGPSRASPNWRPLVLLSYTLNYRISDLPWGFHAANVLLNASVAGMLYLVLRRLLATRWGASGGAALYAVLPIHTEAVANIVGRAELLAALFVLAAWWLALGDGERERTRTAAACGLLVLLGMLSKESAAVAAGIVPLSAFLLRRRIPWRSTLAAGGAVGAYLLLRALLLESAPGLGDRAALVDNPLARAPAVARAANATALLGLYAWRTVFPLHLAGDHSYDQLPVLPLSSARLWCQVAAVAAAFLLPAILLRRRRGAAALGLALFPLAFAATANLLFPIGTIFAERLAFLPSAGFPLALAAGLEAIAPRGRGQGRARAAAALLAALTIIYGARTWARNRDWADVARFNIRLAADSPRSTRAHAKAAEGYVLLARRARTAEDRERHLASAEAEVAEALRIHPGNSGARAFGALILLERGKHAEALAALEEAVVSFAREGVPPDLDLLYLRGEILFQLGRFAEARASLDGFLERKGPAAKAFNLRGACRMRLRDLSGARQDLDRAIALDPRNAVSRMNRGILLALAGESPAARRDLDEAVRLDPENPQAWSNRGYLRFQERDVPGAVADYRRGIEVCERKGLIAAPGGESVLAFRMRIAEALNSSGDAAGARREVEAIRDLPHPSASPAAKSLEAQLK